MKKRNLFIFIFLCLAVTILIFFYKSSYKHSYSLDGDDLSYKDIVKYHGDIIKEIVNFKGGRKKSSAEEILDYALLALKSDYSFNEYTENILKEISETYKKIGNIKKASLVGKLQLVTGRVFVHNCYEPYYGPYEQGWLQAKKLLDGGQFDEAIKLSQRNPYALAKIAAVYLEIGQKERIDALLARAYEEAISNKDDHVKYISLAEIVSIYKKTEEYDKAISIISSMTDGYYRDAQFASLAKVFSKKKKFDEVFKLLKDIKNTRWQVSILIDIANEYNKNNLELDNNKIEILRKIAHLTK